MITPFGYYCGHNGRFVNVEFLKMPAAHRVFDGLREDKPAAEVRRAVPFPKADGAAAATKK